MKSIKKFKKTYTLLALLIAFCFAGECQATAPKKVIITATAKALAHSREFFRKKPIPLRGRNLGGAMFAASCLSLEKTGVSQDLHCRNPFSFKGTDTLRSAEKDVKDVFPSKEESSLVLAQELSQGSDAKLDLTKFISSFQAMPATALLPKVAPEEPLATFSMVWRIYRWTTERKVLNWEVWGSSQGEYQYALWEEYFYEKVKQKLETTKSECQDVREELLDKSIEKGFQDATNLALYCRKDLFKRFIVDTIQKDIVLKKRLDAIALGEDEKLAYLDLWVTGDSENSIHFLTYLKYCSRYQKRKFHTVQKRQWGLSKPQSERGASWQERYQNVLANIANNEQILEEKRQGAKKRWQEAQERKRALAQSKTKKRTKKEKKRVSVIEKAHQRRHAQKAENVLKAKVTAFWLVAVYVIKNIFNPTFFSDSEPEKTQHNGGGSYGCQKTMEEIEKSNIRNNFWERLLIKLQEETNLFS
jgi:hypothetical protein